MGNVVARGLRDPVHYLIHSRDHPLQEIHLFADYFVHDNVRDNVRERQNALQPVHEAQWYPGVLVVCFQELMVKRYLCC